MNRTERLLARGYFPSQLPPCFSTGDLANGHATFLAAWIALQDKPNPPKAPLSKPEMFSVARVGHQRRATSLPNPVAQTYLATHVAEHWGAFVKHYRKSRLSASHPRFLADGSRGASIPSMQHLYDKKIALSAGYRYMLRTDLSRFFPTIYTHSVPWAFHTKAVAKKKKDPTPKYFGNLLDLALRQGQDGQTIGLPIGPDTSHLIAEAIATTLDTELRKRLKGWPAGFRYVDDYFMFFSTLQQAEEALAALVRVLKDFELQINFEKTAISPVIEITDDYWTHQLTSFEIRSGRRQQPSDINHFFELAKDLAKKNSDESVMIYALKRVSSTVVRKEAWTSFESHLCHIALAYPNTLQTLARILSTYARIGYPLSKSRLGRLVNSVVEDHAGLGHHSEVVWALWMCWDLDLSLSDANVDRVSEMHSSVCALLLLKLHDMGKLGKAPKNTYWNAFETSESLHGDLWLLSYEAGVRGWAAFGDAHIDGEPRFRVLRDANVRFFKDNASLPPIFHVKATALKSYQIDSEAQFFDLDDIEDFDDLIEFDAEDGGYEGVVLPDDEDDDTNVAGSGGEGWGVDETDEPGFDPFADE